MGTIIQVLECSWVEMPQELHNLSNHQQCKGVPVKHCRCVIVIDTQKYSFSRKLWDQKFSSVIQFRSYISKVWDSLIQSRLALNSPLADDDLCLHLKSTGVTGMCHLPSLYFNFKVKNLIIGFICYRNITEKSILVKYIETTHYWKEQKQNWNIKRKIESQGNSLAIPLCSEPVSALAH